MRAMIQTARLRIAYRELPGRLPEMTLTGISQGATCSLCRKPIELYSLEVQFTAPGSTDMYSLHPDCHKAWAVAVQRMSREKNDGFGTLPSDPVARR